MLIVYLDAYAVQPVQTRYALSNCILDQAYNIEPHCKQLLCDFKSINLYYLTLLSFRKKFRGSIQWLSLTGLVHACSMLKSKSTGSQ